MFKRITLGALAAVSLVACGSMNSSQANIRVVHASADTPAVDVYVNGNKVKSGVTFGQNSGYLSVTAGATAIKVCATGTTTCPIDTTNSPVTTVAGQNYTVLAVGSLSGGTLQALLATDDLTAPASGNFKLRLIHAAPAAPTVDVYVTAPGASLTSVTPNPTNFAFKSINPYISAAAGNYQVRITGIGSKTPVIDTGSVALAAGKIYTAVAVNPGTPGTTGALAAGVILLSDN